MDDEHESELRRIIENRRKRGSLKSQPSDLFAQQQRQLVSPRNAGNTAATVDSVRQQERPSPQRINQDAARPTAPAQSSPSASRRAFFLDQRNAVEGDREQRPPGPSSTPKMAAQNRVSFLNNAEDRKLRESQALQEKKVDQLQDELRSGLSEIRRALNTVIQEQRHGSTVASPVPLAYADSNLGSYSQGRKSSHYEGFAGGPQLREKAQPQDQGHLVDTPRAVGSFSQNRGGGNDAGRYRSGQETVIRKAPPVVDSSVIPGERIGPVLDGTSQYQEALRRQASATHLLPSYGGGSPVQQRRQDATTVNSWPVQPPINARPYSKTTIDVQSSLTVLSEGEWWYKWDSAGERVKLRWVWLDHSRRALSWSPKQVSDPPLFGPRIPIEEMMRVKTTQIAETDPHGNPRIFYILLLECTSRLLQLGSERRDKVDLWYECLSNVMHGTRQAIQGRVASSMGSE
jgi:hypothetical protein